MKIILLKDVAKVGKRFDIKDVADGYALNLLIPKGLAQIANTQAIKNVEAMRSKDLAEKKIQGELLAKSLEKVKDLTISFKEKANEKGHLFRGITKEMLAEEIQKVGRLNIDTESIILQKPLKEVGTHKVTIEAMDKKAEFTVNIEAL